MKITDYTSKRTGPITLNDIPVGQAFRGTIKHPVFGDLRGLWFKKLGRHTSAINKECLNNSNTASCDVFVVRLGDEHETFQYIRYCYQVENYQPVDVELIVTNPKV